MTTIRIGEWLIDLAAGTASSDDVLVHVRRKLGGELFVTDIIGRNVAPTDAVLIGREVLEAFETAENTGTVERG